MLETIEGIVIKTQDYGETHKIITIYSKEKGKISAICRGANRPRSRFTSVTQLFIQGRFLVYLTKGLSTIQQGEVIQSFRNIREDIIKTAYASYMVELFDKLTVDKKGNSFLYDELLLTLERINEREEKPVIPILMLELKLYKQEGFAPVVAYCINCQMKNLPFSFSINEGGLLCKDCQSIDERAVLLPNSIAKLLAVFLDVSIERIDNINIKENNQLLLRNIFDEYYDQYGSYTLKSRRFLKQLDKLNQ